RMQDQNEMEMYLDVPFTRARFEEMIRDSIMRTIDLVRTILSENNTTHEEIDRIVFIGGPSRIPLIRQLVSSELGIATDVKTDPMTAVAIGAAYYCEGRQWTAPDVSEPKPVQASAPVPDEPRVTYSYTSRTPNDKTIVTVHVSGPEADGRQVQLVTNKWDSGMLPLADSLTILVPLEEIGKHEITAHVLDEKGTVLPQHDQKLTIDRLVASTGQIPAAQTIAIKALSHVTAQENTLMPLVKKNDTLPATGSVKFTAARALKAREPGHLSFELFQIEYEDRVDLNLCIGVFRIGGEDLPNNYEIKQGASLSFDWQMTDSGILQANVRIESDDEKPLELKAPRFYAPQTGQVSFAGETGVKFATAIVKQGESEWGDLAAAVGPEGGPEVQLLKMRLQEQNETLLESKSDPESLRRVTEEVRFIRQDIARIGKKHRPALLQRRLGKMTAVYNRIARGHAKKSENERFDNHAGKVQAIIDGNDGKFFDDADLHMSEMRDLFFAIAWRDPGYVKAWFKRLSGEAFLFPDTAEFETLVKEGNDIDIKTAPEALREIVKKMLAARISLGASDTASELANIVKA
ncbi:MAG: Hsp70 family protein, partial [Alphaproteobacteria bacterium]|nr:Hsp70 family protein [Alphaproteobacteria bacterium]